MIISIDYDDTYTRDPIMWNTFVEDALERGHVVWCVSARHQSAMTEPEQTIGRLIGHAHCVGTNGVAKRDHLFKTCGVYADVWIDDMPDTVTAGYDIGDNIDWVPQYVGKNVPTPKKDD